MENILFETKELETGSIGILTVNRPKALNALDGLTLKELSDCLQTVEQNKDLRCLIITGAGKAFVAGADIKDFPTMDCQQADDFAALGQKVFRQIELLRIPVIAAVNGFALGGGLELALSCDFIYALDRAKFGLPEVTLGLIPGFGGTVRLARVIGLAQAREWTYRGDFVGAQEAVDLGLVNKVFASQEELMVEAQNTAQLIASRGPVAVAQAKKSINDSYDVSVDQAMEVEKKLFSDLFQTQDQKEGAQAFIEKRSPQFKGI